MCLCVYIMFGYAMYILHKVVLIFAMLIEKSEKYTRKLNLT